MMAIDFGSQRRLKLGLIASTLFCGKVLAHNSKVGAHNLSEIAHNV